jgi:hypothetical protein
MEELISNNSKILISILFAMLSGLSIRVMLTLVKQKWAATYHHTMSYILLPVITLVITTVITGNIALSLGMIGALSIVRFRNPVKNPFELVIFFALITIGISTSVNYKYGLLLAGTIDLVIFVSYLFEVFSRFFGIHIFSSSFNEGNSNYIIEIQSSDNIALLDDSKFLIQYVHDKKSNEIYYRLSSRSKNDIESIKSITQGNDSVLNIDVRYA